MKVDRRNVKIATNVEWFGLTIGITSRQVDNYPVMIICALPIRMLLHNGRPSRRVYEGRVV